MAQVFYRKWRPQTLAEVVGQEHVTRTLLNALSGGHVSHAYLFCGPRGTGKTSTGRILAKAVNCVKTSTGGKGEPCNKCVMCKSITEGRALDIIEIDAASHTGVDDVRELIERVNYAPAQAKYKVYIIDEVHMLSGSASNALLKTLEEPPPKVIFILATTETHKVLPTIVSRCQRFDFHRLSQKDTEEKLSRITQAEGINIAPEALRLVAKSARGGLRDAENLLEQIYTYYGAEVSLVQVQEMLGMAGNERARELVKYITQKDIGAGLKAIGRAAEDGLDLKQIDREVVSYLRELLLLKSGLDKDSGLTKEEMAELKTLAEKASLEQILRAVKLFGQIEGALDNDSTLPLELALVDACIEPVIEKPARAAEAEPVRTARPSTPAPAHPAPRAALNTTPPAATPKPVPTASSTPHPVAARPITRPVEPPKDPVKVSALQGAGSELAQLKNNWALIIQQVPDAVRRSAAVAMLRSAGIKPIAIEGDTVVLSFKYPYHREKIEELENKKIVAGLIGQFLGRPCQIKCVYEPEENHLVREAQKLGAQIIEVEEK
ncbi:MAG: DNA polymerase III subunit gamma/tau [Dehalococcoidia bacterium]|nr:MAG: DNA polymerase III subunit gamma/tau [Dehalococcoidia bacterium]